MRQRQFGHPLGEQYKTEAPAIEPISLYLRTGASHQQRFRHSYAGACSLHGSIEPSLHHPGERECQPLST
jgi:hypothetical protein